jgi:hypothetical protein
MNKMGILYIESNGEIFIFNINPDTKQISFRDEIYTFELNKNYILLIKKIKTNNCEETTTNIIKNLENTIKMRLDDINHLKKKIIETIDENYELDAKVDVNYYIDLIHNHKNELKKIYNKEIYDINFKIKKTITKWKCPNNVRITLHHRVYLVWMPILFTKTEKDKPITNIYENEKTISKKLTINNYNL